MMFLLNILLLSAAVFVVASLMPAIRIKNYGTALIVALVYSVINFLIGWLLRFLALPFIWITLGLFTFVINAFLLWVTDKLIQDFEIKSIVSTLIAAFLITLIHWGLRVILF
jgi:putative membrane protein